MSCNNKQAILKISFRLKMSQSPEVIQSSGLEFDDPLAYSIRPAKAISTVHLSNHKLLPRPN